MTSPSLREQVARIVDRDAWEALEGRWEDDFRGRWLSEEHRTNCLRERQGYALAKADLILALPQPPLSEGWQDIASAPRDGTMIWAAEVHPNPRFRPVQYEGCFEKGSLLGTLLSGEENPRFHNRSANTWAKPTHWRPLPDPPLSNGGEGQDLESARDHAPTTCAATPKCAAPEEAIWRTCHVITGDCKRCPETETIGGDECIRGCRLQATECVNVVETGNLWRKTEGVRAPWTTWSASSDITQELLAALIGVVRVADRATTEFDAARAAIAKVRVASDVAGQQHPGDE